MPSWTHRIALTLRDHNSRLELALVHEPDAVTRFVGLEPGAWVRNPDHHKPPGRAENELERAARVCRRSVGCGRLRDNDLVVRRVAPHQVTMTMAAEPGHWCTYVDFSGANDCGGGSLSPSSKPPVDDKEPRIVQLTRLTDGSVVGHATLTQDSWQYRLHGADEHISFVNLSHRVAYVRRFRVRHCADGEPVPLDRASSGSDDAAHRLGVCMPPLYQSLKRCTGCDRAHFCGTAHFAQHRKTCRRSVTDATSLPAVRARSSLERCHCLRCVRRKVARRPAAYGAECACSVGDCDLDRHPTSHGACQQTPIDIGSASSSAPSLPPPAVLLPPASTYSSADDLD